jgi:parallel beta-helix repeat protein
MAQIAGISDSRGAGVPADVGLYQLSETVMVFRFTFSGVTDYVAIRAGVSGWVLVGRNADPAVAIEAAWAFLNGLGGGELRTRGAGETWTIQTQINSQGAYVTWKSDPSLILKAKDALNLSVILIAHDYVTLEGIKIDGNKANQGVPNGLEICGIVVAPASYWKILRCVFYNIHQFGFWSHSATAKYGGELGGCIFEGCSWNGILIGANTYDATVHDCTVTHSSDVGIAVHGVGVLVSDCVVRNMDLVEGAANSQWCFAFEGVATLSSFDHCEAHGAAIQGANLGGAGYNNMVNCIVEGIAAGIDAGIFVGSDYNTISGCTVKDCGANTGIYVQRGANYNYIEDCEVYNLTLAINAWGAYIYVYGSYTTIQDCRVWSATAQVNINGIILDGSSENPIIRCLIDSCRVWGFGTGASDGILIKSNADYNWVIDCLIHNCQNGIEIEATADAYNTLLGNKFYTIGSLCVLDSGTDTILPTVRASFIKELGTAAWIVTAAAPMGIDIDAANEGALAKIKLPPDLQKVVRIKVWGIAQAADADGMQLQVAAGAGGDNEAWNAEAIAVASKTSATLNFAIGDVMQWVFTSADDADIGDLAAGDFLQWCCYYAASSGANIATDLLLAGEGLEIQYV